jgi:hypothetical protein
MSLKTNDMDSLQLSIVDNIQSKMIFNEYEELIDHIFEHKDYASTISKNLYKCIFNKFW